MEQEKVFKFQLDYSEDIEITLIGTPGEIESFLYPGERGEGADPITVFAPGEQNNPVPLRPQEQYYQQLESIEDALASGRGATEDPIANPVLLPNGLFHFLDELPGWLQPNVIRPRRGFLDQPALLPRPVVAEWDRGIAVLTDIAAQYDLPSEGLTALVAARGLARGQTFEGFLIVGVINKGGGCRQWKLDSRAQGANSLRVYTFQSSDQNKKLQCKVDSGSADFRINVNGAPWSASPGVLTPASGWQPADEVPSAKEITTVVRNPGSEYCAYVLRGGCNIVGLA